jgi:hypothetical protein
MSTIRTKVSVIAPNISPPRMWKILRSVHISVLFARRDTLPVTSVTLPAECPEISVVSRRKPRRPSNSHAETSLEKSIEA